jgi:hypothetical protein
MKPTQREIYDATLDDIRESARKRRELDAKTEPVLSEIALQAMAIRSAEESAS